MLGYALLGLLVGTLINHAANELPKHGSLLRAPSCPHCGQALKSLQWISIIGLITGRRRCFQCKKTISWRAPIVELVTAGIFAYLWARYQPSPQLALYTLYSIAFILIFIIDLEHRLILNIVMGPAILLAVITTLVIRLNRELKTSKQRLERQHSLVLQ